MKWLSWGLLCLIGLTIAPHGWTRGYGRIGHPRSFSYRGSSRNTGGLSRSYLPRASGEYYTRSHIRRDGAYVRGHYSTTPNQTKMDNWSTRGNYNPHTGQEGTKSPY